MIVYARLNWNRLHATYHAIDAEQAGEMLPGHCGLTRFKTACGRSYVAQRTVLRFYMDECSVEQLCRQCARKL